MEIFLPDIYQQSIYKIDYNKLKKSKIKCLIFDLNNTIAPLNDNFPNDKLKELFEKLKDMDFKIIIVSNSNKKRVTPFKNTLNIDCSYYAWKPFKNKYKKIMEMYNYKVYNIACIGDCLFADIFGANRMGFTSILVNSLAKSDCFCNKLYNPIENFIKKKLTKKELLIRGSYYE